MENQEEVAWTVKKVNRVEHNIGRYLIWLYNLYVGFKITYYIWFIWSQKGEQGDDGPNGLFGLQGEKGEIGEQGIEGKPGIYNWCCVHNFIRQIHLKYWFRYYYVLIYFRISWFEWYNGYRRRIWNSRINGYPWFKSKCV